MTIKYKKDIQRFNTSEIRIAGCFQHKCGHHAVVVSPLLNNDELFTLNLLRKQSLKDECSQCGQCEQESKIHGAN